VNWFEGRLAAFDIETTGTGVEDDRIVTAAVSLVGGGQETVSRTWLVDPGIEIPAEAIEVHRITTERARREGVSTAAAVDEITGILARQLADDVPIVAFNARFDLTILDREARRHGVQPLIERIGGPDGLLVVDPYVLDRQVDRYRRGRRNLAILCEFYGVPLNDPHAADADALAAARLAWKMGRKYPELGQLDLPDLHERQVEWAAAQAEDLQRFFNRKGRSERVEGAWPVVPCPEPVEFPGRLAA